MSASPRWTGAPNWYLWDGGFVALGRSEGSFGRGLDFVVNGERQHHDEPVKVGELQVWEVANATESRGIPTTGLAAGCTTATSSSHAAGMMAHFEVVR